MTTAKSSSATPPPAAPAVEKPSWQKVVEGLQLDIVYGRLQPREHLIEDDLMRRFGVSRYAVRRALEELQSLGLASRTENRGTRIRSYSPQEVFDLYDIRELLETRAAQQIPMPVPAALVDELVRIQKRHDAAARKGDLYNTHIQNDEFHRTLFSACPNTLLSDAIANYSLQVQPVRMRFFLDEDRRRRASVDHWEMIDAIKSGDSKLLARVCSRHLTHSKMAYAKSVPAAAHLDL
ncbi:MAG: GntR family transcriptional regulator [Burkholderiaceae bacterium]|nr:GntR family transcriptional regulator [Burkholderiaceae bacterium]